MSELHIEKSDLIDPAARRIIGIRTLSALSSYALDYSDETIFNDIEDACADFGDTFLFISQESRISELSPSTLALWLNHDQGTLQGEDELVLRNMSLETLPGHDDAETVYDRLPSDSQEYLSLFGLWAAALFTATEGDPLRDDSVPSSVGAQYRTLEEFEPFERFWDKASQFHPGGGIGGEVWEDWPTR